MRKISIIAIMFIILSFMVTTIQAQSQLETDNYVISQFVPHMNELDICVFEVDVDNLATVSCHRVKVDIIDLSDVTNGDYEVTVPVIDISAILIRGGGICGIWYYKHIGVSKLDSCDPIIEQLIGYPRDK